MKIRVEHMLAPEALRRVPLLAHLGDAELADAARQMQFRRFARGTAVLDKGDSSNDLMFLLAGELQVVDYTEDGCEIGLNMIVRGDFFGELALVDGRPRSASVVALNDAVVAFLPREPALRLVYGNPGVAEKMLKHFTEKIRRLTDFRALLAIPNANRRVFALLCMVKRKTTEAGNEREMIENLPTQQQMSIMINTSRETVSRALAILMRRGIVRKTSHSLLIEKPGALEALAAKDDQAG